jgi:hypothetical protein
MGIKVYLPKDEREMKNIKKSEAKPMIVCQDKVVVKKENPVLIQVVKSNPITIIKENPKTNQLKLSRTIIRRN